MMIKTSFAQNFEDIVLWRALGHFTEGFYVDVGAGDPSNDSVTKLFYDNGWSGVNIEPVIQNWNNLNLYRSRDINLNCLANESDTIVDFYEIPDTGLSTVIYEIAQRHIVRGYTCHKRSVSSYTLNTLLAEFSARQIHFLKIDVEGHEEAVLKGLDLSIFRPIVILFEIIDPVTKNPDLDKLRESLETHEYSKVYYDGINMFYLAKEFWDLAVHFSSATNIRDEFILNPDHALIPNNMKNTQIYTELLHLSETLEITKSKNQNNQEHLYLFLESLYNKISLKYEHHYNTSICIIDKINDIYNVQNKILTRLEKTIAVIENLQNLNTRLEDVNKEIKKEHQEAVREITNIHKTMSWRLTSPARLMKGVVKSITNKYILKTLKKPDIVDFLTRYVGLKILEWLRVHPGAFRFVYACLRYSPWLRERAVRFGRRASHGGRHRTLPQGSDDSEQAAAGTTNSGQGQFLSSAAGSLFEAVLEQVESR